MKSQSALVSFSLILIAGLLALSASSQNLIENVMVETYYISDDIDATASVGGTLEAGSVTYRVYVDLAEGVQLRAMFGNENHTFRISSSELFFNNEDRGELWGFDIPDNRLDENTVALDSWLSFGGATDEHYGVLKMDDVDGSFVGGANHEDGLLINDAAELGVPLTSADGLVPVATATPVNFFTSGDDPFGVFGELSSAASFESTNFRAQNAGFQLPDFDNKILVAQLTTKGELNFCINLELIDPQGVLVTYVCSDENIQAGEVFSPLLNYPPECGCTDPNFLEYTPAAVCDDGSCQTPIIFGCSDPAACNYDPEVNFNVQELCCILPDNCPGLDPSLICPDYVGIEEAEQTTLRIYPNPGNGMIQLIGMDWTEGSVIRVFTVSGAEVYRMEGGTPGETTILDLSSLGNGMYILSYQSQFRSGRSRFVIQK